MCGTGSENEYCAITFSLDNRFFFLYADKEWECSIELRESTRATSLFLLALSFSLPFLFSTASACRGFHYMMKTVNCSILSLAGLSVFVLCIASILLFSLLSSVGLKILLKEKK